MSGQRTWPPERWPTAEEWLDWLLAQPREEQIRAAGRAINAAQEAGRCFEANHAGRLEAAEARHRDLVSRLGFGDNITEPMADNDTIVAWFEQQSRDANEWQESQLWRNDCYVAGHPEDEDCWECDPALRLAAAEAAVERVRALADADPFDEDGYCQHCGNGRWKAGHGLCLWADLRAALGEGVTGRETHATGAETGAEGGMALGDVGDGDRPGECQPRSFEGEA